ncbi:MAG: substrate-binding domain-containing protein [Kiritimatiellae bacterium]|nr:substrate-binding domain-containing protein [Kiritimatiellia bacterium]
MKNILYFQYPWRLWRLRLAGIFRYATPRKWRIQIAEHGLTAMSIAESLRFWAPDGCIVERSIMDVPGFDPSDFKGLHVVYCDPDLQKFPAPCLAVKHDSDITATTAANELVKLGLAHFAYVGNIFPRDWSARRRETMAAAAAAAGGTFTDFEPSGPDCVTAFFDSIRPWLKKLPRPCGILAANDITGDLVLQACRMERLRVPDDIAVIGIDNDELICEHTTPTLTSAVSDFELSGFIAAQLLDDAMQGRAHAPCVRYFGAKDIFLRSSTRVFKRRDGAVRHAIELIRSQACSGLTPARVCREIGGSRRMAETRFRNFAGRTIGDEIREARVARAKSLLLEKTQSIESIYFKCGYADASALRRAFKQSTGMSMRAWRATNAKL